MLALIVVIAGALVVANLVGRRDVAGPSSASSAAATAAGTASTGTAASAGSTTSAVAAGGSVCGLPGYVASGTVTSPPVVDWQYVGVTAAPHSATAGPGRVEPDGFRYCYAHTPEGAILATANLLAVTSDLVRFRERLVDRTLVPGPGAEVVRKNTGSNQDQDTSVRVAGFRLLSYSADKATVDLVARIASQGAYVSFPFDLQWVEGDWRVVVRDDGSFPYKPTQVYGLVGYVLWQVS
ncbi:hypothetical protein [Propionicicella superfundia]|uniref:hypothetical protein n=1 Tax=Propionicicella superfundia TaxID=348582 RepID=UPI0012EC4130|nr:hypothetical protein [Propionicicella superfundia]